MSILAAPQWIQELCEQHDLYEYRVLILVKLPNGKQFVTDSPEVANKMQAFGAETVHITELGE